MSTGRALENWATKHRPLTFDEVCGQADSVAFLKTLAASSMPQPILLEGPSGSGKTTLSRVFARQVQCTSRAKDGEPCGTCSSCSAFRTGQEPREFEIIDCGQSGGSKEYVLEVIGDLYYAAQEAAVRVVHFDEAQGLSRPAVDALLKSIESGNPSWILFSLIAADQLPVALLDRCQVVSLKPPTDEEAQNYLRSIAQRESVSVTTDALALLAASGTSYRRLIRNLQHVATRCSGASVTPELVRDVIFSERSGKIANYLEALVAGDRQRQFDIIAGIELQPAEMLDAIREGLLAVRMLHIGDQPIKLRGPMGLLLEVERGRRLAEGFRALAEKRNQHVVAFFDEVLEFWAYMPLNVTDASLRIQVLRFHDLIHYRDLVGFAAPGSPAVVTRVSEAASAPKYRSTRGRRQAPAWRSSNLQAASGRGTWLDRSQVAESYEAATFLIQEHGVTFNMRLTMQRVDNAPDKLASVTKGLREAIKRWSRGSLAAPLPYLVYQRRGDAGVVARMVGHLPREGMELASKWLTKQGFAARDQSAEKDCCFELWRQPQKSRLIDIHWSLVRDFWSGVSPDLQVHDRHLCAVLGIAPKQLSPNAVAGRRFEVSRDIGPGARAAAADRQMQHLSAFADGAWDWLFEGWEFDEHQARKAEEQRRRETLARLDRRLQEAVDPLAQSAVRQLKEDFEQECRVPPRDRRRQWILWPDVSSLSEWG